MANKVEYINVKGKQIPFIFEQNTNLPLISMQLIFKNSGSLQDGDKAGLVRFIGQMYQEGTKTLGNTAFANELEKHAIDLSASCGNETFVFELSALKEHFEKGVGLLDDVIKEPNLTKESLEKVKTITLADLARKEDDFDYIASNTLKTLLFKGTPLQNPMLGNTESVKSIRLDDITTFTKSQFVLDNAVGLIGGDLSLEEAKAYLTTLFTNFEDKPSKVIKNIQLKVDENYKEVKKNTEQAYIYFGAPYFQEVGSKDGYKSRVAMYVLGAGGFGSRLMEEVRVKRGLAYSAYSRANINKSHSYFTGYLQTKLDSQKEAIALVKEVIENFVAKGITQQELEGAKKFLTGSEPLRVETLNQRLNRAFLEFYHEKEQGNSQKELDKIENLSLEEINAFIKEHKEITKLVFAVVNK